MFEEERSPDPLILAQNGGTKRIMRKIFEMPADPASPLAEFFKRFNDRNLDIEDAIRIDERMCRNNDLLFLYMRSAVPERRYARDIVLLKHAFEAYIPVRYRNIYNIYVLKDKNCNAKTACEIFAVYVLILEIELEFTEDEAIRIMQYITMRYDGILMPDIPPEWKREFRKDLQAKQERPEKAANLIERLSRGTPDDIAEAALMYFDEDNGVPVNRAEAYRLAEKACKRGKPPTALAIMGECLYKGEGIEEDKARGEELIRSAAEAGSPLGEYYLGEIYKENNDIDNSLKYYQLAYDHGYGPAVYDLAIYYKNEKKEFGKARELLSGLVNSGDPRALFLTAQTYYQEDEQCEYLRFLLSSAENGSAIAATTGALYCSERINSGIDKAVCRRFFIAAAKKENTRLMYMLSELYKDRTIEPCDCGYEDWSGKLAVPGRINEGFPGEIKRRELSDLLAEHWFDKSVMNGATNEIKEMTEHYSQNPSMLELLKKYADSEYERVTDARYELLYDRKILAGIFRRAGKKFSGYAVSLYSGLMESGDKDAVLALAEMYAEDGTVSKISEKAVKELKKLAASGDVKAQYIAASVLRKRFPGETGEMKYRECIGIAEDTALFGWKVHKDIQSAEVLGMIYETYHKELCKAKEYYEKAVDAADGGRAFPLCRLIRIYTDNSSDPSDAKNALACIMIGLMTGSPEIFLLTAEACQNALFGAEKLFKAPEMYYRATECICPEAEFKLGELLTDSNMNDETAEWAERLLTTGTEYGDERFGLRYARLIMNERKPLKRDIGKAEKLLIAAIKAGHTEAYNDLAKLYSLIGNTLGAIYWYCLAYKNGDEDCKEKIFDILNTEEQLLKGKSTELPRTDEAITSALRSAIDKVGDDEARAIGYLLFDNITDIRYYGIITLIYHAFVCGAAEELETSGYKKAAVKLAEVTLAGEADIAAALSYIAEAYGLKVRIPAKNGRADSDSAEIGRLRKKLTSVSEPDFKKIIGIFGKMSDAGSGRAAYLLGRYYDCAYPVRDTVRALGYFRHGMETGGPDCTAFVGKYLLEGIELENNVTAAVYHLAKAFAEGSDLGGYFIELCADALSEDLRLETVKLLEKSGAAETNPHYLEMLKKRDAADTGAWKGISDIIRNAELSEYGSPERLKLYRIAALHGYPDAMNELVNIYKTMYHFYDQQEHIRYWNEKHTMK